MEPTNFIKYTLISMLAVFAPIKMLLITVGVLIFADALTGIIAAKKRNEEISSAGMRRTVTKMFVYQLAVITGFMLEVYLLGGSIPVSKLVAGFVGTVEFKSMLENATEITGLDFKSIIQKLGSKNDIQ